MTSVEYGELLHAYKYAVEANQDGIAELLEDVIIALLMDGGETRQTDTGPFVIPTTPTPPWHVTCEPLGCKGTWVGTDPLTHTSTTEVVK